MEVGRGVILGQDMFMEWEDPDPHAVNAVHLATGQDTTGVWEFYKDQGQRTSPHSEGTLCTCGNTL